MAIRRLWYLAALLGSWMFYMAYGEWFSWILLLTMLGLPWLSLLLSLPAILRFRAEPSCPEAVTLGSAGTVHLLGSCPLPMPPFRGRLRLQHAISGEKRPYPTGSSLPTAHCGGITVTPEKVRVLDYLGLFSFPVKNTSQKIVRIRPLPLAVDDLPPITQYAARAWKPKFGGGFAENHELRLYRPGDSLNQVHWKLTAKTGQMILREPMEPIRGLVLLTMTLKGTPEELDRKFGRLLWVGNFLLRQETAFTLRVLTGEGLLDFSVDTESALHRAIDALLCTPAVKQGSVQEEVYSACWQYHIGGAPDET